MSDDALLEGSLERDQYEKLLSLWEQKGAANWVRKRKVFGQSWRSQLIANLKIGNSEWRRMILRQAGDNMDTVQDLIDEAQGDPLMFLNRLGVSPFNILYLLETFNDSEEALRAVRSSTSSKESKEFFEKAARMYRLFQRAFPDVLYEKVFRRLPLDGAVTAKRMAKVVADPGPNGMDLTARRGAPVKALWRSTIGSLVSGCESRLEARLGRTTGRRIMLATITTILMCAFNVRLPWRSNDQKESIRAQASYKAGKIRLRTLA
jgi:hypothetical protein